MNNEYVVQFKKGVFELGVPINPVAIKYNKVRASKGATEWLETEQAGAAIRAHLPFYRTCLSRPTR